MLACGQIGDIWASTFRTFNKFLRQYIADMTGCLKKLTPGLWDTACVRVEINLVLTWASRAFETQNWNGQKCFSLPFVRNVALQQFRIQFFFFFTIANKYLNVSKKEPCRVFWPLVLLWSNVRMYYVLCINTCTQVGDASNAPAAGFVLFRWSIDSWWQ